MTCTCPTHHTDTGIQRFAADVSCPIHGRAIVQTPAGAALEAVTRQRDELLAALKELAPFLRNGDVSTRGGRIELDRLASLAESAIAKTEGRGT